MFPLNIRAYGKINLFLEVGGIMENGLHSIRTVFHRADLYDDITVEKTDSAGIEMICDTEELAAWGMIDIPEDGRNLIHKAISRFHESIGSPIDSLDYGYFIKIKKRIPAAGGMGGGSADAGCVLAALNCELGCPLSEDKLVELAASLGDDVPFFLFGRDAMLADGSGSRLGECPSLPPCRMEFVSCGEKASTAEMYRAHDRAMADLPLGDRGAVSEKCDRLISALESGDWKGIAENVYNSFETVFTGLSEQNAERFKKIADELYGRGAAVVMLSGSGPTVCGIFPSSDR